MPARATVPHTGAGKIIKIVRVMVEIDCRHTDRFLPIGHARPLEMRVGNTVYVADYFGRDLKRAKFAVLSTRIIVSAGFDRDEGREEKWMHDLNSLCA